MSSIPSKPRNLVLLFDGTTDTFNAKITNIPVICSLLSRDPRKQVSYYQTGIGTYVPAYSPLGIVNGFEKLADNAVAWNLHQHVQDGYRYLMQYYNAGDKIFIFGFSRGAYCARALAGMLQVVGLLMPGNYESIPLAYSIFSGKYNAPFGKITLPEGFKRTFCREVGVHMIGVFDTVASVGALIPQILPFSSGTSHITHFRQALSLDERRTKFMPQLWLGPTTPNTNVAFHREDEIEDAEDDKGKDITGDGVEVVTSVKQVYFCGSHSDVGGGVMAHDGTGTPKLSNLSLKWILREAVEVGLELDSCAVLNSMLFSPYLGLVELDESIIKDSLSVTPKQLLTLKSHLAIKLAASSTVLPEIYLADSLAERHDALSFDIEPSSTLVGFKQNFSSWFKICGMRLEALNWWILEVIPTVKITWNDEGTAKKWWISWNNGKGRKLPLNPTFHTSVKLREDALKGSFPAGNGSGVYETKYVHKARFEIGQILDNVTYVD